MADFVTQPFLSHFDVNVSDLPRSAEFYDVVLSLLNFRRCRELEQIVGYTNGSVKIFLLQCEQRFLQRGYHRKGIGLNHMAYQVDSRAEVDRIHQELVRLVEIEPLYGSPRQFHTGYEYYALFFEDPDRIKLEVVYSPEYMTIE